MRHKKLTAVQRAFVEEIRALEERLFPDQLDDTDPSRMKSNRYSWHYRPSHHVATGLLTKSDSDDLSRSGKRLLSIGAYPAYLERVLLELGVPPENIVVADNDPAIANSEGSMQKIVFDAHAPWPDIGTFDLIIFPESLCIAVRDHIKQRATKDVPAHADFPNDALEAELLSVIIGQALERLRPGGEIRANGPMSHPNVIRSMSAKLGQQGRHHVVTYHRFFLLVQPQIQ